MKLAFLAPILLSLSSACVATKGEMHHDPADTAQAFDTLKSLAGTWHGTATMGTEQHPVDLSYEVVSAGSAVLERLFLGTPHEMVTLYHKDGDRLLLTHYCSAGNQPRMQLVGWSAAPEATLSFSFADATNWAGEQELIMHDARITKISDDHIATTWTAWTNGKADHTANFDFQRVTATKTAVLFSNF